MPEKMGDFGIAEEDVDHLVKTLEYNKGSVFGGFKQLTMDDARKIYLSAF